MLNYLFLIFTVTLLSSQNVVSKLFSNASKGHDSAVILYNVFNAAAGGVFFIVKSFITSGGLSWHLGSFLYAIPFSLTFYCASLCFNLAVRKGPLALSTLFLSYSLLLPTLYGIIFLNEQVSLVMILGFITLATSIFLINFKKTTEKINMKWLILSIITFFANGFCSISEKAHQNAFPGEHIDEFLSYSFVIITTLFLITYLFTRKKEVEKEILKPSMIWGSANGVLNASSNLFTLLLAAQVAASLMYPVMSAGQLILTFTISLVIFKERYTKPQYVGAFFGVVAIVLLNL